MMKILIIEDEAPAAAILKRLLRQTRRNIVIEAVLETVEASVNWLSENPHPDLVFMDVQLDDGLCFEIFESVVLKSPVVFTTAYDEYALRAFRVNSIDYILKPMTVEAVQRAVEKYETLFAGRDYDEKLKKLLVMLPPAGRERFLVKIGEHYRPVQSSNIRCAYIMDRSNFFFMKTGKSYPVDYSLDKLERLLDPSGFFRVNRNVIISYTSIKDLVSYSASRIKVDLEGWNNTEDEIIVSRDRVAAFKAWMER